MGDEENKKRILVVEDELYVQGMLEDFLTRKDYAVSVVPTAEAAFAALEKQRIDLVLLDKNLPDMSGVEVLSQLRFNNPTLPVIFMTGYPSERSKLMVRHLGISAYFEKPVNLKVLAGAINEALQESSPKQDSDAHQVTVEPIDEVIKRLSQKDAKDRPQVLLVTGENTVVEALAQIPAREVTHIAVANEQEQVFDFLQSHTVDVLAVDFSLPGGAALALVRWAGRKDPTMSLLALVAEGKESSDLKKLADSLNIRYTVSLPITQPDDVLSKLDILLKRTRTLRAFQEAVT
jgi:DNA-binding response OmpR family regulator